MQTKELQHQLEEIVKEKNAQINLINSQIERLNQLLRHGPKEVDVNPANGLSKKAGNPSNMEHPFCQAPNSDNVVGPKLGFRGIQGLKKRPLDMGERPEEKIRTFEGALDYMLGTPPGQFLMVYRGVFPMPANPCQVYKNTRGYFAAWVFAMKDGGVSEEYAHLGRKLYAQRRKLHAAKENPRARTQLIRRAMGDTDKRMIRFNKQF